MENRPTPYHELPGPQSIRVLSLLKPPEIPQSSLQILPHLPLECGLTVLDLAGPIVPEYSTLSYSWPDESETSAILCDGCEIHIRPSLVQAMEQIWSSEPFCNVWVDALCIHQATVSERNSQVALIGKIYSLGERVVVWLGNESEKGRWVFDLMNHYQSDQVSRRGKNRTLFRKQLHSLDPEFELSESFEWLAGRPWFRRCWTFQEIILARAAVLYLGYLRADWTAFTSFIGALDDYPHPYSNLEQLIDTLLLTEQTATDVQSGSLRFCDVLVRTKTCRATDSRDKIFSLLGLIKNGTLEPDYNLTVREVLVAATKECIRNAGDLSVLALAGIDRVSYADRTLLLPYQQAYPWSCQ